MRVEKWTRVVVMAEGAAGAGGGLAFAPESRVWVHSVGMEDPRTVVRDQWSVVRDQSRVVRGQRSVRG